MRTAWALLSLTLLAAPLAHAQVFSPGALSKAHKDLDGLTSCTKCHPEGDQHDNGRCLECHKEIDKRVSADRGYHNSVKAKLCAECHREHRGLSSSIIEWQTRNGRPDTFNHNLTGWDLKGAHAKNKCADCHDNKRVVEDDVRQILTKSGRETTYLGLATRCVSCHFDEHRGQEGNDCARCHTTEDFEKAPLFDHNDKNDAKFPIVGKHKKVNCKACHELLIDSKKYDGLLVPKSEYYAQLKDVPHGSCVECHEDYHKGAFGPNCAKCHTPEGFQLIKEGAKDSGFHDKHAFKLRGAHTAVDCKSCHGPFPGQAAVFKGVKFKNCADCHMDAHLGQLDKRDGVVKCDDCHTPNGFALVGFDVARHEKTRFPLEGTHTTTACNVCHVKDKSLEERVPKNVQRELERQKRALVTSDAVLDFPKVFTPEGKPTRCEACHSDDDPHAGQFTVIPKELAAAGLKARNCAECHASTTFIDRTKFNHDDSRFPLSGKHAEQNCNECHFTSQQKSKTKGAVIYRPLPFLCQECHADAHVGQLEKKDGVTACGTCHATTGFKDITFNHDKDSTFALNGSHEQVECKACHPAVDVGGTPIARYKPLPTACESCHKDEHGSGWDSYMPSLDADSSALATLAAAHRENAADAPPDAGSPVDAGAPVASAADAGLATTVADAGTLADAGALDAGTSVATTVAAAPASIGRCNGCHVEDGWSPALFAHDRTTFPLTGRHNTVNCASCHFGDYERTLSPTCMTCHRDPHAQEFGTMCASCHTTDQFRGPDFPVDAHRRLNFPLNGRHAALPCDECHVEKRDRTYTRAALDCASCHQRDARAANAITVDHGRRPFSGGSCRDCHATTTFSPATFVQHEACFPITRGVHAPVRCYECHQQRALIGAQFTTNCNAQPVLCATCHAHAANIEDKRHKDVSGYEHKSEKCVTCHRLP